MMCLGAAVSAGLAACGDNAMIAASANDTVVLTAAQVSALQNAAVSLRGSNPLNADVRSLVDSTLLVLTAGVQARRVNLTTTLSPAPQYFVGIHRVFPHTGGSSSTWNVVGMDDFAALHSIVEISGFAQNSTGTAPETTTGTIGTGFANVVMMEINSSGGVATWHASSGAASFASTPLGTPCPGFTATARVSCTLETMRVTFTGTGSNAGVTRAASLTSVDVPAMRLTYTIP
jgi:hypothetical protein